LKKVELPSEAAAKELQGYLEEKRFTIHDRNGDTIEFAQNMKPFEWARLVDIVEKWASKKQMKVDESLKLQFIESETREDKDKAQIDKSQIDASQLKKKLDSLSSEMAEQRYNYLQSKPISELTDEEYEERLILAQRDFRKKQ